MTTTTTAEQRCANQVRHIIEQIMSHERDYAQGFLPRHKRASLNIRRGDDYGAHNQGHVMIYGRLGSDERPVTYDVSDDQQLDAAVERVNAFMARGGRIDLGNWKRLDPSARIYVDTSR